MSDARGIAYRPEIDGLRAIAVVSVILFHGGFPGFGGGFIGVDLFFVISGYLITGILAADLAGERFSILRFYERRIRRIIPALMVVMLVSIPLAWWLMLPDDLENFGQSLVGTTLFANNILLMLTSGYFAHEGAFKPLMHTWSLGVEEQYYLAVPLLMGVAWRWGKARGLLIGVVAVTALSFIICLIVPRYLSPEYGFFLIFSRGWELGAGALAVLLEPRISPLASKTMAAGLACAGMALIATDIVLLSNTAAPGVLTLIPVAGISLILLFGNSSDPVGRLLASPPFVRIGLISYSAYLVHYPVFAFVRLASLERPDPALMAALLAPILILAWLSWRFVEQPFRDPGRVSTRTVMASSGAAALVVLAAGLTFHLTSGFYRNWPELADRDQAGRNANIAYNMAPDRFMKASLPENGDKVRILVIGNSFARDFINMALETGRMGNHVIAFRFSPDCPPLGPEAIEQVQRADFIILSTRFRPGDVRCITRRLKRLHGETSVPIIVIGRKSFGYNNNAVMRLPPEQRYDLHVTPLPEAVTANDVARKALSGETYIDMLGMLGDAQGRVPVFTPDRKFISQDREHLTRPGAIYIGGIIFQHPALKAVLDAHPSKSP